MNNKSLEPTDKDARHFAQLDEDERAEQYIESRSMEIADSLIAVEKVGGFEYSDITGEVIFCDEKLTEEFESITQDIVTDNNAITITLNAFRLKSIIRQAAVILGERIAKDEMASPDFGFDAPDDKGAGNV